MAGEQDRASQHEVGQSAMAEGSAVDYTASQHGQELQRLRLRSGAVGAAGLQLFTIKHPGGAEGGATIATNSRRVLSDGPTTLFCCPWRPAGCCSCCPCSPCSPCMPLLPLQCAVLRTWEGCRSNFLNIFCTFVRQCGSSPATRHLALYRWIHKPARHCSTATRPWLRTAHFGRTFDRRQARPAAEWHRCQ